MKSSCIFSAVLTLSLWIGAATFVSGAVRETTTIKVGEKPESVCRGFGGKLYVTMIGGDHPGDGTINVIDKDNQVSVFARGLNAPKGIAYVGGYLVTADETNVWKIDAKGTVTKLAEPRQFPRAIEFLNDVAVSLDGKAVYVTDMSSPGPMFDPSGERKLWAMDSPQAAGLSPKGCVYRVGLDGTVTLAVPAGDRRMGFPNGVTTTGTRRNEVLVMGDFFTGNIVAWRNGSMEVLAKGMRGADAVEVTKDTLYVSSWNQGKVWAHDRKTGETRVLLEGLITAADFFHDRKNRQLIIPDMLAGTLTFLPLQ